MKNIARKKKVIQKKGGKNEKSYAVFNGIRRFSRWNCLLCL